MHLRRSSRNETRNVDRIQALHEAQNSARTHGHDVNVKGRGAKQGPFVKSHPSGPPHLTLIPPLTLRWLRHFLICIRTRLPPSAFNLLLVQVAVAMLGTASRRIGVGLILARGPAAPRVAGHIVPAIVLAVGVGVRGARGGFFGTTFADGAGFVVDAAYWWW